MSGTVWVMDADAPLLTRSAKAEASKGQRRSSNGGLQSGIVGPLSPSGLEKSVLQINAKVSGSSFVKGAWMVGDWKTADAIALGIFCFQQLASSDLFHLAIDYPNTYNNYYWLQNYHVTLPIQLFALSCTVTILSGLLITQQCFCFVCIAGSGGFSLFPTPTVPEPVPTRPKRMKKRIKRTADPQPDPEPIFDPAIDDGTALAPGSGEEDDEVPPQLFFVPEPPQPKEAQEPQPPKKRRRRSDSPAVAVPREVPEPVAPSVPVEPSPPGPPRRRSTSPTTPEATIPAVPSGPSAGLALAEGELGALVKRTSHLFWWVLPWNQVKGLNTRLWGPAIWRHACCCMFTVDFLLNLCNWRVFLPSSTSLFRTFYVSQNRKHVQTGGKNAGVFCCFSLSLASKIKNGPDQKLQKCELMHKILATRRHLLHGNDTFWWVNQNTFILSLQLKLALNLAEPLLWVNRQHIQNREYNVCFLRYRGLLPGGPAWGLLGSKLCMQRSDIDMFNEWSTAASRAET